MIKTKRSNSGFTLVEIMIVLAIIGLIVSIAIPAFLKNRRDAQGSAANAEIDSIYSAKEQIAFKLNARPGQVIAVTDTQVEAYMRGVTLADGAPDGGTYTVGTLIDGNGIVVIPTCSSEVLDPDADGVTHGQEGLFIHRRSYLRDTGTGLHTRNPLYTFAT
jgi:prepilin-type N-terminal cleavage/methylation domain-containing protein